MKGQKLIYEIGRFLHQIIYIVMHQFSDTFFFKFVRNRWYGEFNRSRDLPTKLNYTLRFQITHSIKFLMKSSIVSSYSFRSVVGGWLVCGSVMVVWWVGGRVVCG